MEIAPGVTLGGERLPVLAGPCVIESADATLAMAKILADMAERLGLALVFKSSFDKANRSSWNSFRGPGLDEGLDVLRRVHEATGLPIVTDVHEPAQCAPAARVAHILQIPAFLCRQTDLISAAAETGRTVNLKKGQFLAPDDVPRAVEKARKAGAEKVFVTERGTSFGYHDLVVDMRGFAILQDLDVPVVFDITHSLQRPGGGEVTGGDRRFAEPLARAAVAAGADGVFLEVHADPENALSDATTQLRPDRAEALLASLVEIRRAVAQATPTQPVMTRRGSA